MYIEGANIYNIREKYKIGNNTIKNILKNNNIQIRDGRRRILTENEKKQLCQKYINGESLASITNEYKMDEIVARRILKENGIKMRSHKEANKLIEHKKLIWDSIDLNLAKRKYIDEKLSLFETGKILDISPKTLKDFLVFNNVSIREGSDPERNRMERDIWSKYPTKEIIKSYNEGDSIKFISESLNMNQGTITRILNRNNIKRRTINEWYLTRKHWHKKYVLPSGNEIYVQGYEPQFLDYVFQKKLLKEEEFDFQPKTISYMKNSKKHHYFPDFHIPKLNMIVEVKSPWVLQKQTPETQLLKEQATKQAGFDYILILDNNFEEFAKLYKQT